MAIKGQSITITYTVWDTDTAAPKSGDVNNHTCRLSQNGGTFATATNTPADIGYGIYALTLTATETNCDELTLQVSSSTSGVAIPPIQITFDESSAAPSAAAVASAVWNYTSGRTITNTIPSAADIADAVWDEIVFGRSPLVTDSAADILITASAIGTPSSIWNYANRSLTSEVLTRDENYQPIKTLAISSEITTAKDAILTRGNSAWITATGFSTFNPATDTVIINATQAATLAAASDLDSVATKVELIKSKTDNLPTNPATATDVTTAQAAIIAAMPDVTGLSTFDASTDTVTINATQAATMVTATGFATPSDIPTADITAIKTKVDTLNNTDLTGIATAANITTAQNAIINAMPDISGLSTFDAANDTVTINATQAATMVTADVSGLATPSDIPTSDISAIKTKVDSLHNTDLTGIATSANISTAQTAIISHGDENWTGGGSGGGATPKQIWEYADRTLTASPTDISSLATKSDLTTAVSGLSTFNANTDKVSIKAAQVEDLIAGVWAYKLYLQNVGYTAGTILAGTMGLSDVILDATDTITTYGDEHWTTAIIPTADITHIKNKVDTLHNTDLTGIATSSDITNAQTAILSAVPAAVWGADLTTYSDTDTAANQIYTALSNCATGTDTAVLTEILKDINAGVLNWSVTANALTIYNDNNTVRGTYILTRDVEGNITKILPNS